MSYIAGYTVDIKLYRDVSPSLLMLLMALIASIMDGA
jgi:hypothetical protein